MIDKDGLMRAFAAIAKDKERENIKKSLRVIKAAQRAGVPVKRVIIAGVELEIESLCQDETKGRDYGSSNSAKPFTAWGVKRAATGSYQRALEIGKKLKSSSPSSSTCATATQGRVIPMKSS